MYCSERTFIVEQNCDAVEIWRSAVHSRINYCRSSIAEHTCRCSTRSRAMHRTLLSDTIRCMLGRYADRPGCFSCLLHQASERHDARSAREFRSAGAHARPERLEAVARSVSTEDIDQSSFIQCEKGTHISHIKSQSLSVSTIEPDWFLLLEPTN